MATELEKADVIRLRLGDLCEAAKQIFEHGPELKATIILRHPTNPDRQVIVSEDDDDTLIALLQDRQRRTIHIDHRKK